MVEPSPSSNLWRWIGLGLLAGLGLSLWLPPSAPPAALTSPVRDALALAPAALASLVPPALASPVLPIDVPVPGDRPLRVAQALPEAERAIVYLPGMCGAEKGADVWADLATKYGTLITLRADVPCDDRPGYKWPKDPSVIQARIERALELVRDRRAGRLSPHEVLLVGYSQGAHRAERLAAAYPHRYRTLVLGGPPGAASPERLRHARRIAVLGGELEDTSHMVDGYLALRAAGIDAEFFTLPRAGHGSYGPEGRRIMEQVFAYLLR